MMLLSSFYRAVFLSWLLLGIVEESVTVSGQGVTVDLDGLALPNNSLVDFDDIPDFSSDSGVVDDSVLNCRTDLEACCNAGQPNVAAPGVGEWYYPNGTALTFDGADGATFRRNRGSMNVRLWRRATPPERGRFRCELPNAQNVNQTVYVNILNIGPVTITASGGSNTGIAGTSFSLVCSATVETQTDTPTPNFDWFFGPNNGSLPSGATPMSTVMGNTYTSTLQFSPLQESHAGMYTCRLGSNARLAVNDIVSIEIPSNVTLSSSHSNPVQPVGSAVTLTCTVELSPAVDVPVTVNTVWTGPNGFSENGMAQRMGSTTTYTSTAMVSSFGRDQSGVYNCTAAVGISRTMSSGTRRVTVGVYLNLKGVVLTNNSVILVTRIGETGDAVQCITDRMPCCSSNGATGQWSFPDGEIVGAVSTDSFYLTRGSNDDGTVRLNRNNTISPTGLFCCVVPDAVGVDQTQCINITPPIYLQINSSAATPTLGESYRLDCTLYGANTTAYQWRKNDTVFEANTTKTLFFPSFKLSNAAHYSCNVTVANVIYDSEKNVTLKIPAPTSVTISSSPEKPIAFASVTLTCTVELHRSVDTSLSVVTEWSGPPGFVTTQMARAMTGSTTIYTNTYVVSSFGRNESGNYSCATIITSTSLFLIDSDEQVNTSRITAVLRPPLNVQATQSSASVPVEVSWSPPSSGATNITGYRIFYGNGKNASLPSAATNIGLTLNKDSVGETVSVRSEADQIFSEFVNATVTNAAASDRSPSISSCSSEVGIAVGVIILLACLIVAVVSITVVLCWRRKKSSHEIEFAVSANVAYGEVKLDPQALGGGEGDVYEDPEKMVSSGRGNDRQTDYSTDHEYEVTRAAEI